MPSIVEDKQHFIQHYREFLGEVKALDSPEFRKAGELLEDALEAAERNTGQLLHAVGVARIIAIELGLGRTATIAALLHNLSETGCIDTSLVRKLFGPDVVGILDGYNRIGKFHTRKLTLESENFRKLLFSQAGDIRAILLKLADRLYHVRHIDYLSSDRQQQVITEAAHLYAGIAHKLGLYHIKNEFEDAALKVFEPDVHAAVTRRLKESSREREAYIRAFITPLNQLLREEGFDIEMKGRSKSVSGIVAKMRKQNVDFEEVFDVFAIRIIIDTDLQNEKADCWKVYSLVTSLYSPNPKRMRDWITTPRDNGYESLHTTVLGAEGKWVEVQIRSRRMDLIAEKGPAAHWRYKGEDEESEAEKWINRFRELLERSGPVLPGETTRTGSMYADDIFVFTPAGELRKLTAGSTVLDFAYEIHTNIGSTCSGARVNGKQVPIRHELQNGDMVEVLTSKNQEPKLDWLKIVRTNKARSRIKRAIKEHQYKQADIGKEIFRKKLEQLKVPYNDVLVRKLLTRLGHKDVLGLYQAFADDRIEMADLRRALREEEQAVPTVLPQKTRTVAAGASLDATPGSLLIDEDPGITDFSLAACCRPVYGTEVFAFITVGKGITVHRLGCPNARQMRHRYPYRVLRARWIQKGEKQLYSVVIRLRGSDRIGLLNGITDLIGNELGINLISINIRSGNKRIDGTLEVEVRDELQLGNLMHRLEQVDGIEKVSR